MAMTDVDTVASQMLAAIIGAREARNSIGWSAREVEHRAERAYQQADALCAERDKRRDKRRASLGAGKADDEEARALFGDDDGTGGPNASWRP